MAQNDWMVAGLNNPDFTSNDFSTIADMNLGNTQFLSADEYMKSDFIKNHEMFKDASGNFSKQKFEKYHKKRVQEFKEFQDQEYAKGPQLDMFSTFRTKDSRVKDIKFDLGRHVNPDRQAVGIEGVRVWSDPTQTKSEIAQSQKVWDFKKQEFKDYSSNDKALSNGLFDWLDQVFSDPLVMAQWEEEGEHIDPITGMVKKHAKGDYKLNDKGTYYYETLGDRSPINKEVLSVFDTLTVDGEGINKYDFFDSDDIEKSIGGVIAKNVVSLLPLFTPVGTAYSTLLIAKEFAKAMPMLYGVATMFSDQQEAPKWINNVAAFGTKFSGGTSQYAKENTFSFENFGNLIADVALQWGQQKAIAQAFNSVRGANTYVDDALKNAKNLYAVKSKELGESAELWQVCQNKFLPQAQKLATQAGQLGRDASLAYMAIVSNSDLYNEMRGLGLTNTEAAAVSLGSTLGMFGLNKYTGIGEVFFDDATDDAVKLARQSVKAEMKQAAEMFKSIKNSNLPEPNKYLKFIQTAATKTKDVFSKFSEDLKYHTLNFAGKAAGEGLEEVSEELISDVAKEIYQLAGYFGVDTTLKDVGAWDNALERYTMSFFGGAIGGGIFYGKEALIDGKSYKRDKKNWEMATLIRNGYGNELRAEIEKLKHSGKLGSTTLSASKYEVDEAGERVWLTTENKKESQNDAMANAMLEKVNALEAVINNNRIGLSDEQLFENMVLTEKRFKRYEKAAPLTNYYQDFSNIINELIAAELDYKKASQTIEGTVNGNPLTDAKLTPAQEAERQSQLQQLLARVEEVRKKKDEFLSGDTSLDYTRKLNFIMDPILHSQFLSIDIGQYFKEKYGDRSHKSLTPEEKSKFRADWSEKVESTLKLEIDQAWSKYKEKEALFIPELEQLSINTPEYKKFSEESAVLFTEDFNSKSLINSHIDWNTQLEGESDEDYQSRNNKKIQVVTTTNEEGETVDIQQEESDEDFARRVLLRGKAIQQYNDARDQEWVDKLTQHLQKVNFKVDPITFRYIKAALPQRQQDIVKDRINTGDMTSGVRQILRGLKPDLSNVDEINQLLYNATYEENKQAVSKLLSVINGLKIQVEDIEGNLVYKVLNGDVADGADVVDINGYVIDNQDGGLTLQKIADNPSLLDLQDPTLISSLTALIPVLGGNVTFADVVQNGVYLLGSNSIFQEYVATENSSKENILNTVVSDISNNPIYKFAQQLQKTVTNPIGELIKSISQKNGDEIPNIDELLEIIHGDFESIEDVNQLILDDTQTENLKKVRDYLKLIDGFMYAASSNPNADTPIGHNQVINSFAQTHKDKLLKEWNPLPEIDSDYYTVYQQAINKYYNEIEYWLNLSDANNINKIRKFVATDRAFNVALFDSIKSRNFKINLNGDEIDLFEGYAEGEYEPEVKLFNAEQLLHRNFQKALKKSGLSVSEFFQKTGLLEKLIPSLSNISKQNVVNLSETLKANDLTDFDLLQYYAQVFTLNPSKFYEELKGKIKVNDKVAPITSQEYASKLAKAMANKQFRDIMRYAYEKSGSKLPFLSNTQILPGVAGAGKTAVVLASINNPNEEIIVAGPTQSQADTLQKSLNRSRSYTFKALLEELLGSQQLKTINDLFDEVNNPAGKDVKRIDNKYFIIESVNKVPVIKLKRDALTFNKLSKIPKKLILDEATHLSSLEMQILDAYAESVDAVVYLAGDPNQRGYINKKAAIENLQEDQLFASRAPKLSISLRDNNLQKYVNQENVRSLLDEVNAAQLNLSEEEAAQFWPKALNTISKFNFKVYNHDEINGDLITKELSPELIEKLKVPKVVVENGEEKQKTPTVGFIGDVSSAYLQKLKDAGITPEVLSMNEMQGREFDFVVIDQKWKVPPANDNIKLFLTDLYTTMTRATTASIFIDDGLSQVIGENVFTNNKSQAPSIHAGVDELRAKKLRILEQFKLDLSDINEDGDTDNPESKITYDPERDFDDPDEKPSDEDLKEDIAEIAKQEQQQIQQSMSESFAADGEQLVQTFSDITITGAKQEVSVERFTDYNTGEEIEKEMPVWIIEHNTDGVLRNLQALYTNGERLVRYSDKIDAQKKLFDIKSAILYRHSFDELPTELRTRIFNREGWEQGKLELEIRDVTESDTTHLNAKYDQPGIEYDGKRYLVNIVFKVRTRSGAIAAFDISGLPSLNRYSENVAEIKANLQERIAKASGAEKDALQRRLNGVHASFANYENLLDSWIKEFNEGKFKPIELDESVISLNQTTWFQDLQKSDREAGLQLGGKLNPITGERSNDNLKLRHPELVFSPVYTFASDPSVFDKIDQSLKGKAVVFVSSDTLLKEDDLIEKYLEQKYNPDSNTPRVRMLVLDNYGMRFSQFIDRNFIKHFQYGDEQRTPFRQNYVGIRMFTSMWNWRAGLINFTEAYDAWQQKYQYTDTQVNALLEAQQREYDGEELGNLLEINRLTTADLDNLKQFNSVECENIPIFRLGYSKKGNGFYVREEDVKNSTMYDKDKVNLLAITPEKAKQFKVLLNRILSALEYSDQFGKQTLGLRLLREDKSQWSPNEFIDLQDAKHLRTLSGLLSDQKGGLVLSADKVTIAYAGSDDDNNLWSMIPAVVSNVVRTITYYQQHPDVVTNGAQHAKITYPNGEEKVLLETQVDDLFSEGHLEYGNDSSLFDLLNLVFHGTTDDIHKKLTKGQQLMQVEDAYFKRGFYINPDLTRLPSRNGDYEIWNRSDEKGNVLFYKIATSDELFTVDTNVRTSGIGIKIDKLIEKLKGTESPTPTPETSEIVEEEQGNAESIFRNQYPEISDIIQTGLDVGQDFEFSLDGAKQAINWHNKELRTYINLELSNKNTDVLDIEFQVSLNGDQLQRTTFRQYITSLIGTDQFELKLEDGVVIKTNDRVYKLNEDFIIKEQNVVIPEQEKASKFGKKLSNGKPFSTALMDVLRDSSVISDWIQDELMGYSEQEITDLIKTLEVIFKESDDAIISKRLKELSEDDASVYNRLLAHVSEKNSEGVQEFKDMWQILLEC